MLTTTAAVKPARVRRPPDWQKKATIPESLSDKVIRFIEAVCRYPEGKLVRQPIVLPRHHLEAIRGIYAEREPGVYAHRLSIISWPRKQAKTGLMACLLICHLCGPVAVHNSQLYSCAFSAEQAALIYKYASKMIKMEPRLAGRIRLTPSESTMTCPGTGVTYQALSSDDKTSYGLSPQVTFFDETGQAGAHYPLWDAMETAKGAIFNPLTVIISTQAADDTALLSVLIDDAANDPEVFLHLVKCPDDIDPLDESRLGDWLPAWNEAWCNTREIINQCRRAARLPSERGRYLNLFANRRVRAESGLVTPEVWDACGGAFDRDAAQQRPAWGGLDMSQTTDLTAFVLVIPLEDGTLGVLARFFLPADGIDERALKDKVPYREWSEAGWLTLCPGPVIGAEWVIAQVMEDAGDYQIREIAFDRAYMKNLKKRIADDGVDFPTLVEFGQGFVSMSPAVQELENSLLKNELRHGMHPILRWNMANAVVTRDPAGNRKFDKSKRTMRIDGAVALAMALGQYRKSEAAGQDVEWWIG